MSIWSHRPQFLHWALFTAAYVVGCGFAKALVIVPGSTVAFWPPGGLLMATLMLTPTRSWPWWILGGTLAESFGQLVWFSSGLPIGFLIIAGNALEAMAGAWLINRVCGRPVRLETLREVLAFVVLGAGLAPVISATIGSATLWWFGVKSQTFWANWPLWWTGDATGILIVAPLTLIVVQNWRGMAELWAARWIEVSVVGLIFLGVAALALGGYMPFAYIVMPPLLWAAVRFDLKGAAVTLILLALITAVFTLSGASQFAGDAESQRHKQIMLHLFLAVSALSALIVAAISRQHQQALLTLRESERQLRELVDVVPVTIARLAPDGDPTFFNKRLIDFLGLDVTNIEKPGMSRLAAAIAAALHPDDAAAFAEALNHSLVTGESFLRKYRLLRADGVYRWVEGRIEPLRDQDGAIVQWYGVSLDIDDEVRAQEALRARERALRQSERQLQQMVDAVPAMIWSATPEGKPAFVNKRFMDVTGTTLEDNTALDGSSPSYCIIHPDDRDAAGQMLADSFKTGAPCVRRYRQIRRDGSYRWTETRSEPLRDDSGEILQWYGVSVDIDDEVRAQEALRARELALRQSERQLQQMIDAVPAMIWSTSREGTPIYVNKRFTDVIGVTVEGVTAADGSPALSRIIHPDDLGETIAKVRESFGTGIPYVMRYRQIRRGGSYRWTETRAEALRDESGEILQWYGVSVDIHDLVTAQEALRDRERELSQLVNMVPVHIRRLTPEGEPTFFNKRLLDFFGFGDVSELDKPGMSRLVTAMRTLVHPDDSARLLETVRHSVATGEPFSTKYRMRRADGAYRWVDTRSEPLRNQSRAIVQWYVISLDIDDEVRAQQALRDRERELAQLVDMVPVYIRRMTPQGEPIFFNKRMMDFHGLGDLADLDKPGMSRLAAATQALIHPDDVASLLGTARRSFASGEPFSMKYRTRRADGAYRWIDTRGEPVRNQSGAIVQWYVVSLDIDDQMRAEEALRDRERELAQLVDMVPVYIRRLTPDGEPVFFNKRLTDFIGVGLTQIGTPGVSRLAPVIEHFVHPDEAAKVLAAVRHAVATGEGYAMKYRMRRADGVYRWMETRSEPVRNQDGTIAQWYVVSIDVDDEVRAQQAEESLRQASTKLAQATQAASLAELSASIAHEVNQPLAAIVANSHACQRWLSADPSNIERAKITVERIIRDANAAADVVGRIRALFRQSVEPRNSATLHGAIVEARSLLAEEAARRGVRMNVDVESDLPPVAFDRVQIQQVLVNLIRNGMDAMDATADDRIVGMRVRRTGDVVRTEISDRGRGVEFPDKIFEPFFTTKENGMGMGLTICRSIVESHGGRLWAERNEPHGATFIFTLPVEVKAP